MTPRCTGCPNQTFTAKWTRFLQVRCFQPTLKGTQNNGIHRPHPFSSTHLFPTEEMPQPMCQSPMPVPVPKPSISRKTQCSHLIRHTLPNINRLKIFTSEVEHLQTKRLELTCYHRMCMHNLWVVVTYYAPVAGQYTRKVMWTGKDDF